VNVGQLVVINAAVQIGNAPAPVAAPPPAGTAFNMILLAGTPALSAVLVFTDPNGITHSAGPTYLSSDPLPGLPNILLYMVYIAGAFEFNKPGVWYVTVRNGSYSVGPIPFLIGPPLASLLPHAKPMVQAMFKYGFVPGQPIIPPAPPTSLIGKPLAGYVIAGKAMAG
jgi:hypothetical protein